MHTVVLRRTRKLLYIYGEPPRKEGDKFLASETPPNVPGPQAASIQGTNGEGVMFFQCSRGSSDGVSKNAPLKKYKYLEVIHELRIDPVLEAEPEHT